MAVPGTPNPWLLAIRPKTLPAALAPLILAGAYSYTKGPFHALPWLAALLAALLIQIASNLANDLFDFRKGADTAERTGPIRVVQAGLISQRGVVGGLVFVVGLAILIGLYLVWVGGWPILAIGLASLLCAILYTGGPFPLGYLGLGELFVFVFFGPVATFGTVLVTTGRVDPVGALLGVPLGFLCANILVVNNVRDVETDAAAGKRTLAVRFGRKFGIEMYRSFGIAAVLGLFIFQLATNRVAPTMATLPFIYLMPDLLKQLQEKGGSALNPILGRSARLELWFACAMALGILVGRF